MNARSGMDVLDALIAAINRRDLDALANQFAENVRSDTPAHPARSFVGRAQIRRNWEQILGGIGDLEATIVTAASSGGMTPGSEAVWAEIAFDGHRSDGAAWQMRGVTVNDVVDGRIAALRFYLEPVDDTTVDVEGAIRQTVGATSATHEPTSPAGAAR